VLVVQAGAPDSVPPQIQIVCPAERLLINQPAQPIDVRFFDAGSSLNLDSLRIFVDGADRTATCAVCSSGAVCPWPLLAEGHHTVTAEIRDAESNLASASSSFDLLLGTASIASPCRRSPTPTSATARRTRTRARRACCASARAARTGPWRGST